ncbi:myosin light chain kinase, smooth muscle-like [Passerculus sandwichensis]
MATPTSLRNAPAPPNPEAALRTSRPPPHKRLKDSQPAPTDVTLSLLLSLSTKHQADTDIQRLPASLSLRGCLRCTGSCPARPRRAPGLRDAPSRAPAACPHRGHRRVPAVDNIAAGSGRAPSPEHPRIPGGDTGTPPGSKVAVTKARRGRGDPAIALGTFVTYSLPEPVDFEPSLGAALGRVWRRPKGPREGLRTQLCVADLGLKGDIGDMGWGQLVGGAEEPFEHHDVVINSQDKVSDVYTQLEKLGEGKFGTVYRLQEKATGRIRAGKYFRARTAKERQAARAEVELMNLLHHPRLVQCLEAFQEPTQLVMVMEYVAGGELFERIVDDDFEHTEPSSAQYMQQILEGLQFMHGQAIVHLDLKPENIVCVSPGSHRVKIIDFGLARRLAPDTPVKVLHGTPEFMAPEVVAFEPVSFSTDMWSVGVICYILLSGESPFQGDTDMETLSNVTAARWDFEEESFSEISQQAKDFISQLLQKEPSRRLPSAGALLHPWLQQPQPSSPKVLSKERIRQFLARRKWQKTGKALLALKRLTLLSQSLEGKASEAQDEEGLEEDQPSRALPQPGANPSELLPDQEEEEEEDGESTAASGQ